MPRIGDFTSAPPPEDADPLTFTLDKVEFTVAAKASGFALGDLVEVIDSGDIDTPRGNRAIVNAMVEALVDEDRAKFRRHCERHRTTAGELWPILTAMAEARSDRPTSGASDSSDGSETTGASSEEPSSSAVSSARRRLLESPVAQRELAADPHWADELLTVSENGRTLLSS